MASNNTASTKHLLEIIENASSSQEIERVNVRSRSKVIKLIKRPFNLIRKRKPYFSTSWDQRKRFKIKYKQMIDHDKEFLKSHGLKCQKIILSPYDLHENDSEVSIEVVSTEEINKEKQNQEEFGKKVLQLKDICCMGDNAYRMFRQKLALNLPPVYQLKKISNNFAMCNPITKVRNGAYNQINEKLLNVLKKLARKGLFKDNIDSIRVKFSGDSTKIGRNMKLLIVTLSIIDNFNCSNEESHMIEYESSEESSVETDDESDDDQSDDGSSDEELSELDDDSTLVRNNNSKEEPKRKRRNKKINRIYKSNTASGTYVLGIFMIENENYDELARCLKPINKQMQVLNEIEFQGKNYRIEKFLGGDWKFLALCLGINSANARQPCIWCKCVLKQDEKKLKAEDNNALEVTDKREWSILDPKKGARSITEAKIESTTGKNGYIKPPIIDCIETHHYIIDMLHLFLRIPNILKDLLIFDLKKLDAMQSKSASLKNQRHIKKFVRFLKFQCKLKNSFFIEGNQYTFRDFTGTEIKKIFKSIKISSLLFDHDKALDIENIWIDFYAIYSLVKRNKISSNELKVKSKLWSQKFLDVYHRKHVTPYIHACVDHLHEFVEYYGDINAFNQQGVEKLNDLISSRFFRSTNKKNFIEQLLHKQNRIETIYD